MELQKILFAIRAVGLRAVLRTLRYSLWRAWIDRRLASPAPNQAVILPGPHQELIRTPHGCRVEYQNARLEVTFLTPTMTRLAWEPGPAPIPYAIARHEWPALTLSWQEESEKTTLSSGQLQVILYPDGAVEFADPAGNLLRRDDPPQHRGQSWRLTSSLRPEEHLYGLGERAAPFNLRPGTYRSWNTDPGGSYGPGRDPLYLCTPVYLGLHQMGSYLVFYENSYPATFSFEKEACVDFTGGQLRYYFIFGTPAEALRQYLDLTGLPGLPPRWALGYHQCRWGYKTEAEIRQVIAGFRDHDLPISAIHLDIDYMDGYRVFTFDRQRFPNPDALIADLETQGVKTVTILDPGVKRDPQYAIYQQGKARKAFCTLPSGKIVHGLVWPGWAAFPDFSDPAARRWWGEHYASLVKMGVAGFWHDMNEPVSFAAWGDTTLPLTTRHSLEGGGGNHLEAHNFYGLLMNQAAHQALRELNPRKRPWLISRSGWAGLQRYAWNWTGDVESTWQALRLTVATILGLSLSGHLFAGPDIGGFSGNPSPELYLRWFQLAAFLPFFRTHSAVGTKPREPWVFGELITSIVRETLRLRYRLLPYLYTLAWEACQEGVLPVRPLFWENPKDARLWDVSDAFLLGDSLLIAPIVEEGERKRRVILPSGNWYDFWNDTPYQGPDEIEIEAPLEHIPVLVKAGKILPLEENNSSPSLSCLTLHVYLPRRTPENQASLPPTISRLFLDAGDGYENSRLDRFEIEDLGNSWIIRRLQTGEFPWPYARLTIQIHGAEIRSIQADGQEIPLHQGIAEIGLFETLKIEGQE